MDIPVNKRVSKKEELNKRLLENFNSSRTFTSAHVLGEGYGKDEVFSVLSEWKHKGWYCFLHERFDGAILDIQIYDYDYVPSNRGINKLVKF